MNRQPYLVMVTADGAMAMAQKVKDFDDAMRVATRIPHTNTMTYSIGFITTPGPGSYVGATLPGLIDKIRSGEMPAEVVLEFVPVIPAAKKLVRKGTSKAETAFQAFVEKAAANDQKAGMILFCDKSGPASSAVSELKKKHPTGYTFASRSCTYDGKAGVGVFVQIEG